MKVVNRLIGFPLVVVVMISAAAALMAQQPAATENTSRPRVASTPPATQEKAKKPAALPTGERLEPDVRDVGPDEPAREARGADGGGGQRVVVEPGEVDVQEREVEARVVRDEHRSATELQERRQDLLDRWLCGHGSIVDAGEMGDERWDRDLGVDQCLERPDALAAEVLDRPDLGDPTVGRGTAGGLQVDDAERDLVQRDAQVERGLDGRGEHGFLRPVGPCGGATISNRCSTVKHGPVIVTGADDTADQP